MAGSVEPVAACVQAVQSVADSVQVLHPVAASVQPVSNSFQQLSASVKDVQPIASSFQALQPAEPLADNIQPIETSCLDKDTEYKVG